MAEISPNIPAIKINGNELNSVIWLDNKMKTKHD